MAERIYLFDTTLRDGAQTRGVDFSVDDKRVIARALDDLGVDYVEGGWPGANPVDDAFFETSPGPEERALYGLRHDPAARPQRGQRSPGSMPFCPRRRIRLHGRKDLGFFMSIWRWAFRARTTSP